MSQKLFVKHSHGNCPNCNTDLEVITPKGQGTATKFSKINKQVSGIKKEIVDAYMRDPSKEYTTREIILRINYLRYLQSKKPLERSNLTRPHSELVGDGIIKDIRHVGVDHYYFINLVKAKVLLNGGVF